MKLSEVGDTKLVYVIVNDRPYIMNIATGVRCVFPSLVPHDGQGRFLTQKLAKIC